MYKISAKGSQRSLGSFKMKKKSKTAFQKIGLISTPWPLYTRPSIQLGTLKAFLQERMPDLQVEVFHFYLILAEAIGYRFYQEISERTWLAESIYSALLYPNQLKQARAFFGKESAGIPILRQVKFKTLVSRIKKATDAFLNRQSWETYQLLGFTISYCQLTSSLYMIKWLKKRFPNLIIVIGGASTSGSATYSLLKKFPEIDLAVNGEGEMPLYHIVEHLRQTSDSLHLLKIQGVTTQLRGNDDKGAASFSQLEALNGLPRPDYDNYFDLLKTFNARKAFFPTLPVEISRGCWWKGTVGTAKVTGCAFCNLNLQWSGYRHKSTSQVVSEIDYLTRRYQVLSVAIMDNVLPRRGSTEIFKQIAKLKKDLRLFGEVRATTTLKELKAMRDCGMREVQIGIEALSSRLLKKLRKGTTAIQNLEIMKNCEALGIRSISNLILQFPASDEQDVSETLKTLEFVLPFYPLKTVDFWLGLGSPVWQQPKKYSLNAVFNHPKWEYLFPREVYQKVPFIIQAYRGNMTYQRKIWRPVKEKISLWQKQYAEVHTGPGDLPILNFRDGGDFIIIRQRRFRREPASHRLVGTSRLIYLHCQKPRSIKAIFSEFPGIPGDKILKFLRMMIEKKLMFEENNNYLSLAVQVK
jgi:ribosomal peptide maturation radical SAM protein 1